MVDRNINHEVNRWVQDTVDDADPGEGTAALLLIGLTCLVVLGGALYYGFTVVKGLWR